MNHETMRRSALLLFVLATPGALLPAQPASLVKDIHVGPAPIASSAPTGQYAGGVYTWFAATDETTGTELYQTLGSAGGATLVKDINTGPGNSFPGEFFYFGSTLLFAASDGATGRELWRSDGSAAGTTLVKDITPGQGSSNPSSFVQIGNTVYFLTSGDNTTRASIKNVGNRLGDLWKTDGTTAGTTLVKKFTTSDSGGTGQMIAVGSTLFLVADDATVGAELWKSDGTTAGTVLVADIYTGSTNGTPNTSLIQYLTGYGGKAYFRARSGSASDYELWVSDGSAAGTMLLMDIRPGSASGNPVYLTVFGGYLWFAANDGATGQELWRTDGTTAGTVLFKDINTASATASSSPYNNDPATGVARFAIMGNAFYFRANDGSNGMELWKSDGTVAGTTLVKDIRSGTSSSSPNNIVFDGQSSIYFSANDGSGVELWKSDGTTAGTVLVADINVTSATASSSPGYFSPSLLGGVVFRANDGTNGIEPWFSDGTTAGTKMIADIRQPGPNDSANAAPREIVDVNGTLFFAATDVAGGVELWKSDGTTAGTVLVSDINPGTASSSPTFLTEMDGRVYFRANNGGTGNELWVSDGTPAGTALLKDIRPGSASSSPNNLFYDGMGTIYFSANDGSGNELWKTDGTAAGTVLVKDINTTSATASSTPAAFVMMNGVLYFRANDGATGNELWRSDGTAAGTTIVADIRSGSTASTPNYLTHDGAGTIYFTANNGSGIEFFKSDGTGAGTMLVKDINTTSGTASSSPNYLTTLGGKILFAANDGTSGLELWVSDGTTGGTVMLKDIWPGPSSSAPYNIQGTQGRVREFARLGNELYFRAGDGSGTSPTGQELWKTDGTASGTVLVKDINPAGDSVVNYITPIGSRHIFFVATDGTNGSGTGHGSELWMSDGTGARTVRVTDIYAGDNNSTPIYPTLSGGRVFFSANDGSRGTELWLVGPGATSQPIGHGCSNTQVPTFAATDPVIGGVLTARTTGDPAATAIALVVGLKQNPLATSVGAGCHLYVDLTLPNFLFLFAPASNGSWTGTFPIANDPSLQNVEIMTQIAYGATGTPPFGLDFGPAVKMVLGY